MNLTKAAGIVLYNPDLNRLNENINAIIDQVDILFMIDNASENIRQIEDRFSNHSKINLIKNEINMGIARALNQIIDQCETNQIKWILLLDQDSVVPDNIIENYNKYIEMENVAIISLKILDRNEKSNEIQEILEYSFVEPEIFMEQL